MARLLFVLLCLFVSPALAQVPNYIGAVGITPIPTASVVTSAAAESSHVLKAAPGSFIGGHVTATGAGFLMLFDAVAAPADGAVAPKTCVAVAANTSVNIVNPQPFLTGVVAVFSSTGCFTKTASAVAYFSFQVQ